MRRLTGLRRSVADMDFSNAGLGPISTTAVTCGDETVTNAASIVVWTHQPVQLIVCTQCGGDGCIGRNDVTIHSLGDDLLLVPAFEAMATDDWSRDEYGPPRLLDLGACLVSREEVGRALPEVAAVETFPAPTALELARLAQWEAPHAALGRFPAPIRLDPHATFVVADGEPDRVLAELTALLGATSDAGDEPVVLREQAAGDEAVLIFIDTQPWTEWTPLVRTPRGPRLRLEPGWIVEPGR